MRISVLRLLCFAAVISLIVVPLMRAEVFITIAPPPIPIYEQPVCPGAGFIWVPGYWAYDYDFDDYFWVPGTWVTAPEVGFFWTPGYWAWVGNRFVFYDGYWGPVVGFYGGIDYGFGYFGEGYVGGRWDHGQFYYNRAVNNVNITNVRYVYNNTTVINNTTVSRVSYNGGNGGINARPTREQERIVHGRHTAPVAVQTRQVQAARSDPQLRASANLGKPAIAATPRPGGFNERGVVPAREAGGPYRPARSRSVAQPGAGPRTPAENAPRRGAAVHPNELPPVERAGPPSTANPRLDRKYEKQQEKLQSRQERERQKLQQRQDQEHQRTQQQAAEQSRTQQIEQRHQQQTQKLQQRQSQQWQRMERRAPPPRQAQGRAPEQERGKPPQ